MSDTLKIDEATLKTRARGTATFTHFTDGALWYVACDAWRFPVPVVDAESGTFEATMKGIHLMRWMRKYMAEQATWTATDG